MGWGEGEFLFSLPHRLTRPRSGHDCRGDAGPLSPSPYLADRVCVPSFYMVGLAVVLCADSRRPPVASPLPPAVPAPF